MQCNYYKEVMTRTKFFLMAFALMMAVMAKAVPAKRVTKTVVLADGTTVELTLRGDEHFSYYTNAEGTPFLLHTDSKLERITKEQVKLTWEARRAERLIPQAALLSSPWANHTGMRKSAATTGKHRGLVILMEFTDEKFSTPDPQTLFNRFFNEPGFSETGMSGSVKDYFLSQSYGQLEVDFDVVGPFTTKNAMSYYGANNVYGQDVRAGLMALEAVDAAAAVVDYSNYDWNGDGEVDQVFIIYAGYAEAQGADSKTIWPHEWKLQYGAGTTRTYNGKVVNTYGCASELKGDGRTGTGVIDGIGSACHEYSHCLGLPDTYDVSGNNYAMANWDVMCAGNYNDDSRTPAGFTSYERMYAGWLQPVELNTQTYVNAMKPLATDAEAYILYNENNRNEFYLLENRQPVDFDRGLNGHGLLILHVDYDEAIWKGNALNVNASRQRMTIIPADNNFSMYISGLRGDPWPGTSGNTALTNYTTPAATLYTENTDKTKFMNKPIENITEDVAAMTISFVACRPGLDIPVPDDGTQIAGEASFTITWPAVSEAVGYQLEVTEIGTASNDPAEALQREFDFNGCISSTTGLTDISASLSKYGLSGWTGSKLYTTPNKLRIGTSTTTGTLRTPTWFVPSSSDITVVMGANTVKEGTTVKGNMRIAYGNQGDVVTYESAPFEVSADGRQVFHFNVRKDLFWLDILPEIQMYINYLAIYDGVWTEEQLGLNTINQAAPRRASETRLYTTETNSYTLTGLNLQSRYVYRVRAVGENNRYSQWSEEKTFVFSDGTGIAPAMVVGDSQNRVHYYDLQGREVGSDTHGLVIMKQGNTVKKVAK